MNDKPQISLDMTKFLNSQINIKINDKNEYQEFLKELGKCGISMRKDEIHVYDETCPIYFIVPGISSIMVKYPISFAGAYVDFKDLDFVKNKEYLEKEKFKSDIMRGKNARVALMNLKRQSFILENDGYNDFYGDTDDYYTMFDTKDDYDEYMDI